MKPIQNDLCIQCVNRRRNSVRTGLWCVNIAENDDLLPYRNEEMCNDTHFHKTEPNLLFHSWTFFLSYIFFSFPSSTSFSLSFSLSLSPLFYFHSLYTLPLFTYTRCVTIYFVYRVRFCFAQQYTNIKMRKHNTPAQFSMLYQPIPTSATITAIYSDNNFTWVLHRSLGIV